MIDLQWKSAWDHRNTELDYLNFCFDICMISWNECFVYSITIYNDQTVAWSFNDYLKIKTLFGGDLRFFDHWGWPIVFDFENGGQAADEHVDWLFEAS